MRDQDHCLRLQRADEKGDPRVVTFPSPEACADCLQVEAA